MINIFPSEIINPFMLKSFFRIYVWIVISFDNHFEMKTDFTNYLTEMCQLLSD